MEEILVAIIQFVVELIGQTLVWSLMCLPFDLCVYLAERAGFTVLSFGGGFLCGWVLLVPFPGTSIRAAWLRIAALIVSPVLAGSLSYGVAELRAGLGHSIDSRKYFWYVFTFTLGLAIARFAYAHHPGG